jgi:uncharacterized RDD family membrane protein YckC
MLRRPRGHDSDIWTGEYSAPAKSDAEPTWSDVSGSDVNAEPIPGDVPSWHRHDGDLVDTSAEDAYEQPPFYTSSEAEMDRQHPFAVARFGPPAGFGRRFVSFLIDSAVTIVILSLLFPLLLGRPYIDYDAITAELEAASEQAAALPTATPVLGTEAQSTEVVRAEATAEDASTWGDTLVGLLLVFLVTTVYNGILVGIWGTTIGKRALNVYVLDANGNIPGIPLAFARALATIASTVIIYIGYLFVFRNDNRALHDLLVGTYAITLISEERPGLKREEQID